MNGWRGLLGGALALIILEVIVTSDQATGRVSGLFGGLSSAVSWLVSADAPGIPDRNATAAATSGIPTTTLASAVLVPAASAPATPAYSSVNTKGATS